MKPIKLAQAVHVLHEEAVEHGRSASVFNNGGSQAVRIPAACRIQARKVRIVKVGDGVYIEPLPEKSIDQLKAALEMMDSNLEREEWEYAERDWEQ